MKTFQPARSAEVASSSFEIIPRKLKTHALERDLPRAY